MIILDLPIPPPLSALYTNAHRSGRTGRVKTERYRTWLRAAGNELNTQRSMKAFKPIKGDVWLTIALPPFRNKDGSRPKRNADISNRVKGAEDLLVAHGLIEDDSYVEDLRVYRTEDVRPKCMRIFIQPARKRVAA